MADIISTATIRPTKLELVQAWMGDQRWYAAKGQQPRLRLLAAWRLDDPEGEVGIETLVVADEAGQEPVVYQVPLTYRGEPLGSADHGLVGTTEHSALGRRWVYDAPHDPVYAAQLLELVQGRVRAQSSERSNALEEGVVGVPRTTWGRRRPRARPRGSWQGSSPTPPSSSTASSLTAQQHPADRQGLPHALPR